MPPGKPFVKPTPEQRALWGAELKRDLLPFLSSAGRGAVERGVEFMQQNPNNIVTQTVIATERDTGAFTVIGRILQKVVAEGQAKAEQQAAQAASGGGAGGVPGGAGAPTSKSQGESGSGTVIDAEFEEIDPGASK